MNGVSGLQVRAFSRLQSQLGSGLTLPRPVAQCQSVMQDFDIALHEYIQRKRGQGDVMTLS